MFDGNISVSGDPTIIVIKIVDDHSLVIDCFVREIL